MSRTPSLRATSAGRLAAALLAGFAAAWVIGACGSGRAETNAKQTGSAVVAHVATTIGHTDTMTTTETQTVAGPVQTVTVTSTRYVGTADHDFSTHDDQRRGDTDLDDPREGR